MFKVGTLDQIAEITMGQSPKGSTVSDKGSIPLLNGPSEFGVNHPHPVQFTSDPKRYAKKGDLLFCVRGSTGKMNWADQDYAIGRGLASIRPKDLNSKYFLRESIEFFLNNLLVGLGGSVFTSVNKDELHKMKCFVPDQKDIEKINEYLENLSKKIYLNQKINHTLEETTKTLFKSWFIDFDPVIAKINNKSINLSKEIINLFPNTFEKSKNGNIPKGWSINNINDHCNIIYGAPFSSNMFNSNHEGIPLIRIRDLKNQKSNIFTNEKPSKATLISKGDIVLGMDGEFKAYFWTSEDAWMNQRICKIVPKKNLSPSFLKHSLKKQLEYIEATEVATTVIHLGKSDLDKFTLINEERGVIKRYNEICKPIEDSIIRNSSEIEVLVKMKKVLISKLISGKIRIPDADKVCV